MTEIIRSGSSAFIPRARLLKLLGGELIRDEVMAIIELVKNAHDADASHVTLTFMGASGPDGEILVEDDGEGMDLGILLNNWMQPAGSLKSSAKFRYTPSGRRVLGEKGVGRFAVDRLGRFVELVSRRGQNASEIVASFDWDAFDNDSLLLSEVESDWQERGPQHFNKSGTLLRIHGLRAKWSEKQFRRLTTRILRIFSPFHRNRNFSVRILSDEFPDYSGEIKPAFLDKAPYILEAEISRDNIVSASFNGHKYPATPWTESGELTCGPVSIRLHAFDLETTALSRLGPRPEVSAWLRMWSGISIFRDSFRVLPYGEPDDDWLRLDQRRINNPVTRLSNNQICGFILISSDENPDLRDQTNRGGLLESKALEDLRKFVLHAIQIIEHERLVIRHPAGPVAEDEFDQAGQNSVHDALSSLEKLAAAEGNIRRRELQSMVQNLKSTLLRAEEKRSREFNAFADLTALGHSASFLHHALRPHVDAVRRAILQLENSSNQNDSNGSAPILQAEGALEGLSEYITLLSRNVASSNRQKQVIELSRELSSFEQTCVYLLAESGARLDVNLPANEQFRANFPSEAFQQVLHILLWNALEWMPDGSDRRIRITVRGTSEKCVLIFQDNGPGIRREIQNRVFDPLFSTKDNGRGAGLTIAKRLLRRYGADIVISKDGRRRGACFEISLKRRKSRSTH